VLVVGRRRVFACAYQGTSEHWCDDRLRQQSVSAFFSYRLCAPGATPGPMPRCLTLNYARHTTAATATAVSSGSCAPATRYVQMVPKVAVACISSTKRLVELSTSAHKISCCISNIYVSGTPSSTYEGNALLSITYFINSRYIPYNSYLYCSTYESFGI